MKLLKLWYIGTVQTGSRYTQGVDKQWGGRGCMMNVMGRSENVDWEL